MTTTVPDRFVAGDALELYDDGAQFPAADGWTLSIAIVAPGVQIKATATAQADGRHKFAIPSSDTTNLSEGVVGWQIYATKAGNRSTPWKGTSFVEPDFAKAAGGRDGRSMAQRTLEAIEATINRRASKDQQSYQIDGRSLARTPIPELLMLRDRYSAIVKRERKAERIRRGLGTNSTIRVRMN